MSKTLWIALVMSCLSLFMLFLAFRENRKTDRELRQYVRGAECESTIDPRMKNYPGPLPAAMYEGIYKDGTWSLSEDWSRWEWHPKDANGATYDSSEKSKTTITAE